MNEKLMPFLKEVTQVEQHCYKLLDEAVEGAIATKIRKTYDLKTIEFLIDLNGKREDMDELEDTDKHQIEANQQAKVEKFSGLPGLIDYVKAKSAEYSEIERAGQIYDRNHSREPIRQSTNAPKVTAKT
jgi:hypothetical protein